MTLHPNVVTINKVTIYHARRAGHNPPSVNLDIDKLNIGLRTRAPSLEIDTLDNVDRIERECKSIFETTFNQ